MAGMSLSRSGDGAICRSRSTEEPPHSYTWAVAFPCNGATATAVLTQVFRHIFYPS